MSRPDDVPKQPALSASDRIAAVAAKGVGALPAALARRLSGGRRAADGLLLDPHVALLLGLSQRTGVSPELTTADDQRERLRVSSRLVSGRPLPGVAVTAAVVDGGAGELPARCYVPKDRLFGPPPLLVWFHGGGWAAGDLDTHDQVCRYLARYGHVTVLSVDYRLAPEHPFPAAVQDAVAAFCWGVEHSAELGCDPARVAVGGDSAGGNLAAVVAQVTRDENLPTPIAQLLVYPVVDMTTTYPSEELFAEGYFLTKSAMDWYESTYYLGTDKADPKFSPMRHPDLAGLAPALVVTAGFDPLRDEGELYAQRLRQAGVPVVLHRSASQVHGFLNMTGVHSGARQEVIALAAAFGAIASTVATTA